MLVDLDEYGDAYRALLLNDAATSPVVVFVSQDDCDSVAAFRTLCALFAADGARFSAYPVHSYSHLQQLAADILPGPQRRLVVLLNCGGTEDAALLLGLAAAPGTRALVIDSHRPLHLSNCAESNRDVFVLRDSGEHAPGRSDGVEAFPGIEDCENGGDDDDDVPSAEDEDTEGDENLGGRNVRPRVDGDSSAAQRKAAAQFRYYARGAFWGTPAAVTLYDVAHGCRRDALEGGLPLWMAVLGLTDFHLHSKMTSTVYNACVLRLAQRVGDVAGGVPGAGAGGDVAAIFARRRLEYAHDTRFFLLRHWAPYDSVAYSPQIAARLRTWSDAGRRVLDRLFAELGIPLAEAKSLFVHMSPTAKAALLGDRLANVAASYGFSEDQDLRFWTFHRSGGPGLSDVAAADVALGVTALLEGADALGSEADAAQGSGGGPQEHGHHTHSQRGFDAALKALSDANVATLRRGIVAAQRLQTAVVRCGGGAITHRKVANVGAFRVLNMATGLHHHAAAAGAGTSASAADGAASAACAVAAAAVCATSSQDVALLLAHPQALLRLGLFIQEALFAQRRTRKPLVLAAPALNTAGAAGAGAGAAQHMWCHVIGVTAPVPSASDAAGNRFSLAFRAAAASSGAPFVHDAFDAACIMVASHKLGPFLEAVQSELDQLAAAQAQAGGEDGAR